MRKSAVTTVAYELETAPKGVITHQEFNNYFTRRTSGTVRTDRKAVLSFCRWLASKSVSHQWIYVRNEEMTNNNSSLDRLILDIIILHFINQRTCSPPLIPPNSWPPTLLLALAISSRIYSSFPVVYPILHVRAFQRLAACVH